MDGVTLLLSDIHLGWRWPAWLWWCVLRFFGFSKSRSRAKEVLFILRDAQSIKQLRILIIGDLLHSLEVTWDDLDVHERRLLKFLWRLRAILINGNHDPDASLLSELTGLRVEGEDYIWCQNGLTFGAIHYDQFDRELDYKLWSLLGDFFECIAAMSGKMHWLRKTWFWKRHSERVKQGALEHALKEGLTVVSGGHRHDPELKNLGRKIFMECGCSVVGHDLTFGLLHGNTAQLVKLEGGKFHRLRKLQLA